MRHHVPSRKILDCEYLNETDAVFSTTAESQFHHLCSGADNVRKKLERPSPFQQNRP